jgi:hypothetical protein
VASCGHAMLLEALFAQPVSENAAFHTGIFDFPAGRVRALERGKKNIQKLGGGGGGEAEQLSREGGGMSRSEEGWGGVGSEVGDVERREGPGEGRDGVGWGGEGGDTLPEELVRKLAVDAHIHRTLVNVCVCVCVCVCVYVCVCECIYMHIDRYILTYIHT